MAKWKKTLLALGTGFLDTQGISLGNAGGRAPRRRRRRRNRKIPDLAAIFAGIREVLQDELSDGELQEFDEAIVWLAQTIIEERREEEEDEEPAPPPQPKRRKKTTKKKAKK